MKSGRKIGSRFLYRKAGLAVIFLTLWGIAFSALCLGQASQEEPGAEITPQPTKPKKKGRDPRAIGLLQLNPSGKTTLIPIAILIDGKFYDASTYKATPVPMVLESGTVYEAMRTGKSVGLFTVNGALHSKNPDSQNPWIGTGAFLATGADAPKTTRKAENVPLGMVDKDAPPRLSRGTGSDASTGSAASAPGTSPNSVPGGSGQPGTGGAQPAKPTESKEPSSSAPGSGAPGSGAPGSDTPGSDGSPRSPGQTGSTQEQTDRPAAPTNGAKANENEQNPSGQPSPGQSEKTAPESAHPTLRRGKPTQPLPEDDQSNNDETKSASKATTKGQASAKNSDIGGAKNASSRNTAELVPAISDAAGPDPSSYAFTWPKDREEEQRKQILSLAASEVGAYVAAQAQGKNKAQAQGKEKDKDQIGNVSGKQTLAHAHTTTPKQPEPLLEKVQLRAFDLWGNSDPILILTAEAHLPPSSRSATAKESWKEDATSSPADSAAQYTITLVAKADIYGHLRKLYSGVTDKYHLDVTPRLELIDAVDADGDGRGELLFREISDAGTGYVIYRATADKLWKMFDSLNLE